MDDVQRFTVVFEGDIRKLPFNPLKAETVFGKVYACGIGDAFEQVNRLEDALINQRRYDEAVDA